MKIVCPSCHRQFKLPEDKLPPKESYRFRCRYCGAKIMVDGKDTALKGQTGVDASNQGAGDERREVRLGVGTRVSEPETQNSGRTLWPMKAGVEVEETPWEEEARPALVCLDPSPENTLVCNALEELGYWPVPLFDPQKVVEKLKFSHCEVVVLDEEFAGSKPDSNPVLQCLQPMPMSVRRGIFFALIGKNFQTFDYLTAFLMSANLVVNLSDLKNLKEILEKAISDNARFYRAFMECMREAGKL